MKIGDVHYDAWVDDAGKVEIDTHVLRTIRGKYGYLVAKNEWTWVKTGFGKNATWAWAVRIDPLYRTRFRIEEGVPARYARSKSQAVREALRRAKRHRQEFPETDPEILAYDAREIAALERRLKQEMRVKT